MKDLSTNPVSYNIQHVTGKIFHSDLWVREIRKLGLTLLFYGIDLEKLEHNELADQTTSPLYIALGLASRAEPSLHPAEYSHGYPFLSLLFRCLKPWKWSQEGKHAVIIEDSNIELNIGEYALGGHTKSTPVDKRLVASLLGAGEAKSFIYCGAPDANLTFKCCNVGNRIIFLVNLWGSEEGRFFHVSDDVKSSCNCGLEKRLKGLYERHSLNFQDIEDVYSMSLLCPTTAVGQKNATLSDPEDTSTPENGKRESDSDSADEGGEAEGWVKQGNGMKIIVRYGPPNAAIYRIEPAKDYTNRGRMAIRKSPTSESSRPPREIPPEIQELVLKQLDATTAMSCIQAGFSLNKNMYNYLFVWKSVLQHDLRALERFLGPSGNAYLIGLGAQQLYINSSFRVRESRPALSVILSWPSQSVIPVNSQRFNDNSFTTILQPFLRLYMANPANCRTLTVANPGELLVQEGTELQIPFLSFSDRSYTVRKAEVHYECIVPGALVSVIHQYKFTIGGDQFFILQGGNLEEPWHLNSRRVNKGTTTNASNEELGG